MKTVVQETISKEAVTTLENYNYKKPEIHFETRANCYTFYRF